MLQRCTNKHTHEYPRYGGAGVRVCDRWVTFENFLEDIGERPEGTSLGRYRDTGDYEPGNVAWMTKSEQVAEQKKKRAIAQKAAA